jgi:hypothetical protein
MRIADIFQFGHGGEGGNCHNNDHGHRNCDSNSGGWGSYGGRSGYSSSGSYSGSYGGSWGGYGGRNRKNQDKCDY